MNNINANVFLFFFSFFPFSFLQSAECSCIHLGHYQGAKLSMPQLLSTVTSRVSCTKFIACLRLGIIWCLIIKTFRPFDLGKKITALFKCREARFHSSSFSTAQVGCRSGRLCKTKDVVALTVETRIFVWLQILAADHVPGCDSK